MALIRPRLPDFHNLSISQAEADFAIPFLDEDIPLYVDPFLLWKSPSQQDKGLHLTVLNGFNHLGYMAKNGRKDDAVRQLTILSECDEVGLGHSGSRTGRRITSAQAEDIIGLFETIPVYRERGFTHFEEIQFYVDGISADRISDITCNFIKSFLIDFTIQHCRDYGIPTSECSAQNIYDHSSCELVSEEKVTLPVHPTAGFPILLVPKRWLRYAPWISFDDYFKLHCPQDDSVNPVTKMDRVALLNFNRNNYGQVEAYIAQKEKQFEDCKNDPLFTQIPITSAKRRLAEIKRLPTGKTNNADKKYERAIAQLMASMMYPHLDFATEQSRTEAGVSIRDLIFYNSRKHTWLKEIFDDYGSRQIVMEIKNVQTIEREHIDQLNRYLADELGKFGVLITRSPLDTARMQSTINLWSGQRRCIVTLTDADIELMVDVFESKQREPLEVLIRNYVQFRQACP